MSPCAFKQHIVCKIESWLGQCHSKYMWIFLFTFFFFCCAYVLVWDEFTELGPLFSSTFVFGFVGFTYCMTSFSLPVTLKHSLSFDEDVFFPLLAFLSFLKCCMLFGTLRPKITKNKISFNTETLLNSVWKKQPFTHTHLVFLSSVYMPYSVSSLEWITSWCRPFWEPEMVFLWSSSSPEVEGLTTEDVTSCKDLLRQRSGNWLDLSFFSVALPLRQTRIWSQNDVY